MSQSVVEIQPLSYMFGKCPTEGPLRTREPWAKMRTVRQSNSIQGANMSEQQKIAYKLYRAECRVSNVEPNRADFLAGEIPACVRYQLALQSN